MVFSQLQFIFYFLPLVLLVYYAGPDRLRNAVLVAASLLFYAWGGSDAFWLLVVSIAVNYGLGRLIMGTTVSAPRRATVITAAAVAFNLLLLGYFKYAGFFLAQTNVLLQWAALPPVALREIVLPVGISFYTFHSLSYLIDVRRGHTVAFRNPLDYALYVSFFPQLIAGPIIRFRQIAPQIGQRLSTVDLIGAGAVRFCLGLGKKVLLADPIGEIAQAVFALPPDRLDAATAWLGVIAYAFQLYLDFSGYSDMAIGLAKMFGFDFPENFLRPYSAVSISDFWRRWHITLSAWFRDYLYSPLGDARRGAARGYVNLGIVFLATGLWHGANWTFVLWGAYHGALLALERLVGNRATGEDASYRPLRRAVVFTLVLLGWVLFRSEDLGHAAAFYRAMFWFDGLRLDAAVQAALTTRNVLMLALAASTLLLPHRFSTGVWITSAHGPGSMAARATVVLVVFPLLLLSVVSSGFHPFLYFRF